MSVAVGLAFALILVSRGLDLHVHGRELRQLHMPTEETMPKPKLSREGEVIAAYGAAMVAAFQVLVDCLEENEAVPPGQFPAALAVYMEMVKSREGDVNNMTLAVLHDIRLATLD